MSNNIYPADSKQAKWARFRFSIIGPLLSSPPESGMLRQTLIALSEKQWQHPLTAHPVQFGLSTIERWFYSAQSAPNPIDVLRSKQRNDAGKSRELGPKLKIIIQQQYREHPSWSYQLHWDNLISRVKTAPDLGEVPSYSTVRRYMKENGFCKQKNVRRHHTDGAEKAALRLEQREVRSFEVEHVHGLWHLDFHHGSQKILSKEGQWYKPLLLCILDDHSRMVCHAQWYLDESAESLVHGFMQALQKRGLPRALMSDNGGAMISAEFTEGLERLGILHQPTLPYSPYQNAKQEVFWGQVEGRLMAMLEGETELTLRQLNEATIAWIEFEYHRKFHSEIGATPLERYCHDPNVGRICPETSRLKTSFCMQVNRKQRRSDGTISLDGNRFEVSSQYRHIETLCIRYARWDLSDVQLIDPNTNTCLDKLYPLDKSANANGLRRALIKETKEAINFTNKKIEIAPLLKEMMAEYAATGLPPAYLPKGE